MTKMVQFIIYNNYLPMSHNAHKAALCHFQIPHDVVGRIKPVYVFTILKTRIFLQWRKQNSALHYKWVTKTVTQYIPETKQQLFEIYFISRLTNEEKNYLIFFSSLRVDRQIGQKRVFKLTINYTINHQKNLATNFKFN